MDRLILSAVRSKPVITLFCSCRLLHDGVAVEVFVVIGVGFRLSHTNLRRADLLERSIEGAPSTKLERKQELRIARIKKVVFTSTHCDSIIMLERFLCALPSANKLFA